VVFLQGDDSGDGFFMAITLLSWCMIRRLEVHDLVL
jgi:hypothetical protein